MHNKIHLKFNKKYWNFNMNKKLIYILLYLLFLSCSNKNDKYGIILDSNNREKLPNGSLVTIENINQDKKATINYNGIKFIVYKFTIEKFQTKKEAEEFQNSIQPYINKYAISKKDLLPLRTSPDNYRENIIHRIPKETILKIIHIGETTEAGSLKGKWLYALTKDGHKGYVFDYALEVFDNIPGKILTHSLDQTSQDNVIHTFKNIKYLRPLYYEKMIANNTYNKNLLKNEYGLFFTQQNKIKINIPELNLIFKFDIIEEVKPNGFLFKSKNSKEDFILIVKSNQNYYKAIIQVKENQLESNFVIIEQNIEKIILESERQNQNLINKLTSYENLTNTQYGNIKFNKDKTFVWEIDNKIYNLPSSGTFEIIGFSPNLQISYKNALKLINEEGKEYFCLIDYTNNALQLIFISSKNVENKLIITNDKDKIAVIIFNNNSSNQDIITKQFQKTI
ncbi:putative lipoprotein [Borrelia recurrentis A1]|uniref:Lipoprotein n=2 Tax=Borrelia recurrentis TaxID=44449 RepID=B5RRK7_BORRA|nr:putative lipoprotein [Borrelia recurrentis A1]